jgi:hypothetical protein
VPNCSWSVTACYQLRIVSVAPSSSSVAVHAVTAAVTFSLPRLWQLVTWGSACGCPSMQTWPDAPWQHTPVPIHPTTTAAAAAAVSFARLWQLVTHSLGQCLWVPPDADPFSRSLAAHIFGTPSTSQQQIRQAVHYGRALNTAFAEVRERSAESVRAVRCICQAYAVLACSVVDYVYDSAGLAAWTLSSTQCMAWRVLCCCHESCASAELHISLCSYPCRQTATTHCAAHRL